MFFLFGYLTGRHQEQRRSPAASEKPSSERNAARPSPRIAPDHHRAITQIDVPLTPGRAEVLQALVDRIATQCQARSAVIADAMGFVVVGTGAHAEALGAFGSILLELGERAQELLPVGAMKHLTIHDDTQTVVTARKIVTAHSELIFASLGSGADAEKVDVSELVARSPAISF